MYIINLLDCTQGCVYNIIHFSLVLTLWGPQKCFFLGFKYGEILKNCELTATVGAILTKFGIVMQFYFLDRFDHWKIEILKIQAEVWYVNLYA